MQLTEFRVCSWPKGCEIRLPDDHPSDLCLVHEAKAISLRKQQAERCQASGEGWSCRERATTKKLGKYCGTHYAQARRRRGLKPIRRREESTAVQDAVKLLELNGWTVIAPTKEESNDGATHASVPHDADARR